METKTRIEWLDAAKGIAIFFIVLIHIFGRTWIRAITLMPAFFLFSGITYSYKENKRAFYGQKVKRILLPYWTFSLISIALYWIMSHVISFEGDVRLLPNVLGMLYGNANSGYMGWNRPLWFLPCLFVGYILIDCFEIFLRHLERTRVILWRTAFIAVSWVAGVWLNTLENECVLPFQLESAVFLVGFFELGVILKGIIDRYGVRKTEEAICTGKGKCLFLIALMLLALSCVLNGKVYLVSHEMGKYPPLIIVSSLLVTVVVIHLAVWGRNLHLLKRFGECSLSILLMHKFPVLLFQMVVPGFADVLSRGEGILYGLCGCFVAVITVALCMLADCVLSQLFPWAIGKSRQKQ